MERKILTIMVVLVVVAALMVAVVMIAAGGIRNAGGFTKLFDELENPTSSVTYDQYLELPEGWELGDTKSVNDRIVDMYLVDTTIVSSSITIYDTVLYFAYMSDKWTDADRGTSFYVPNVGAHNGYIHVNHGLFSLSVSSATNLSAEYNIGDIIGLETKLIINNDVLSFDEWSVMD